MECYGNISTYCREDRQLLENFSENLMFIPGVFDEAVEGGADISDIT
jgi:hypothetical protein